MAEEPTLAMRHLHHISAPAILLWAKGPLGIRVHGLHLYIFMEHDPLW